MGKKNKRSPRGGYNSDDEDSMGSEWSDASILSESSCASGGGIDVDDVIVQVGNLTEKNKGVRYRAIETIQYAFIKYVGMEELQSSAHTLVCNLARIVKKPKSDDEERVACCRLAACTIICLSPELLQNNVLSETLCEDLTPIIRDTSTPTCVTVAAIEAVGWAALLSPNSDDEHPANPKNVHALVKELLGKKNTAADILVQCVQTLGLLSQTNADFDGVQERLQTLLKHNNPDVVVAAATGVGLLSDDDDIEEAISIMEGLQKNPNKTNSKDSRKAQRMGIRTVLKCLENGEEPKHTIVVNGRKVELSGWWVVTAFESLKVLLTGHGLLPHIQQNPIVREMLQITQQLSSPRSSSALKKDRQKQQLQSAVEAKEKTLARGKQRRQFGALHTDGE
eukprot:TRINITY_DN67460_c4_g1_i1.p1 TRINITY_DN67460_c4_g1~~TRINITY_DN67460_c4_g1_i1.p1  ORF type:complete len:395 (+),score=58.40 TRINITY_DN67460_c4_g1_i1:81-1265(+)